MQQTRQTERALQTAREQQASFRVISLISEHSRQGRLRGMPTQQRQQYIDIIRYTAEDFSHRRTSPLERQLSDRYLRFQQLEDQLQGELQTVNAQQRDLEGWLDMYQVPIERMLNPSESDEDDDDDEFFTLPSEIAVNLESGSEDEHSDDEAPASRRPRSGSDPSREQRQGDPPRQEGRDD
jgi:hypothetical protein